MPTKEHCEGAAMYVTLTFGRPAANRTSLAYSADAVYLYSTRDAPLGPSDSKSTNILPPNPPPTSSQPPPATEPDEASPSTLACDQDAIDDEIERIVYEQMHGDGNDDADVDVEDYDIDNDNDSEEEEEEEGSDVYGPSSDEFPSIPVILPRSRYAGICNVETVKDGEFAFRRNSYST